MGTPETTVAQTATDTPPATSVAPTIEEQVNGYVEQMKVDGYKLPDDLDPVLKFAITAEKRRRDTQASYTKTSQAVKKLEAERAELLATANTVTLSAEQLAELEQLKQNGDFEGYAISKQKFEQESKEAFKQNLESVSAEVERAMEIERRQNVLEAFNQANNIVIDDDMIANDVPNSYMTKLQNGEWQFEEFLQKVLDYVRKPTSTPQTSSQPDLNNVGGGASRDYNPQDIAKTIENQWENTLL